MTINGKYLLRHSRIPHEGRGYYVELNTHNNFLGISNGVVCHCLLHFTHKVIINQCAGFLTMFSFTGSKWWSMKTTIT